jgi:hypothetical protein
MDDITNKIIELRSNGFGWDEVSEQLIVDGVPQHEAKEMVKTIRSAQHKKSHDKGMKLVFIGAAICLASMVFTFLTGHSFSILYAGTSVGVGIAFMGLVYIMG